jgi:hypothetical protein
MKKSTFKYFFPLAIIAVSARLFFYPWDYELEPFGPVYIGTLAIMISGLATLAIMIHADRRNNAAKAS